MNKEIFSLLGGLFSANLSTKDEQGEIITRTTLIDSNKFDYQLHIPTDFHNSEELPVIIFLHGIRERGVGGFIPKTGVTGALIQHYFAQLPAIILLPQCRPGSYWSDPVMEQMVIQALAQTLEEFNANANRVYLIGVSMGGYGVWHFASQYPKKFAALVSICGGSPLSEGERFASIAGEVGTTPAWLFHGAEDKIVPVSESRQLVKALQANKGDVKYSEYAGVGHNVWVNVITEKKLLPWLFEHHLISPGINAKLR
jgi:predicted peptidase